MVDVVNDITADWVTTQQWNTPVYNCDMSQYNFKIIQSREMESYFSKIIFFSRYISILQNFILPILFDILDIHTLYSFYFTNY